MDYFAELQGVKESCSILEQPTTKNGGTASGRSAVFFAERRKRRGEDFERREEEGNGNRRRMERGFEEDGNGNRGGGERTLRGGKRTERMDTGLGGRRNGTLRMEKQGL